MLKGFWVIPTQLGRWISQELHLRPRTLETISLPSPNNCDRMRTVILISHIGVVLCCSSKTQSSKVKYCSWRVAFAHAGMVPRSIALEGTGLKGPTELDKSTKIRSSLPSLHKRSACKELATLELPKAVSWLWFQAELERNGLLSAFPTLISNDYLIEAGGQRPFSRCWTACSCCSP